MNYLLLPVFALVLLAMPVLAHVQGRALGGFATSVLVVSGVVLLLISAILTTVRRLYQKTKASEAFVRTGFGGVRVIRDGGALMTGGELAVAIARGAPVKLLLSDNGSYASIRIHQELAHPGRVSGTTLENPDFLRWCSAFRLPVLPVESEADLPKLADALRAPGPMAAVIRTSLRAVLPAG